MGINDAWKKMDEAQQVHYDPGCPPLGSNPQGWCDYRNQRIDGGREWVIDGSGSPQLRFKPGWTVQHTKKMDERAEIERREFNHRQQYPVTALRDEAA